MEVSELLEHDLGHAQVDDLDTAPPLALLAMLSQRSGIEPDRLRCMSLAQSARICDFGQVEERTLNA